MLAPAKNVPDRSLGEPFLVTENAASEPGLQACAKSQQRA